MFEIDGKTVGINERPFIIAELSANHDGKIANAKAAIKIAKESGASAVKIQSYTPDTMTIKSDKPGFVISEGLWRGRMLYDVYSEGYTPFEWHEELFRYAKEIGIILFSTPFDESAVELLQDLDAPAYKIASFELIDIPLIKRAAQCGKPLLMSTGMGSLDEIREAVTTAMKYGNGDVLLFHCISSYPAPLRESNLQNIAFLKKEFGLEVGLSDHTLTNLAPTVAIGMGASAIEKHFKPSNKIGGPDESFSLTPQQLKKLVKDCNDAWMSLGQAGFHRSTFEEGSRKYRRSLYFMRDLSKGSVISASDVRAIRPGYGISPKYMDEVIGKTLNIDVERGDPVLFETLTLNG